MKMKNDIKKQIYFTIIFITLGLVALQVPLTHLVGSKAQFTVFDSFAPIAGGFFGSSFGAVAVLLMQLINFLIHGFKILDSGTIVRLFPTMFAVVYFAKKRKFNLIVPLLAIVAFNLHPIGRSVWYYSLYWLIPVICYFFQERFLLARSLGATFTAHAVGGALWIYTFGLPKAVWISLIPIVAIERLVFAFGIAGMYVVFNNVLNFINERNLIVYQFPVNQKYVLKWRIS